MHPLFGGCKWAACRLKNIFARSKTHSCSPHDNVVMMTWSWWLVTWTWQCGLNKLMIQTLCLGNVDLTMWTQWVHETNFVTWQNGLDNMDSTSSWYELGDLVKYTWQHGLNKFLIWTWWLGKVYLTTWTQRVSSCNELGDLAKWTLWTNEVNVQLANGQSVLGKQVKSSCQNRRANVIP